MAVIKIKDEDGNIIEIPSIKGDTGATGAKGEKGDTGPQGPAGSDAQVTSQNIASALGFTPANAATVSQQSADIADLQTGKQDKLVAGANITIADDGKTISASGGGGGGSTAYEKVADVTIATSGENTVTLSRAIRLTDVYITIINKTGNASSITNPQISPIKSDNSAFGIVYYTGNQGRCAVHITGFPDEIVALSTYHNAGYGGIQAVPNITWAMNNATDVIAFKFSQVNANTQIKIYVR